MDIVQKCMRDETLIFSFVIPIHVLDEFEAVTRNQNENACDVLNRLIRLWIKQNHAA